MSSGDWSSPGLITVEKKGWGSWSTGRKIVIAVVVVFGAGFLAMILLFGAGYWWLTARGNQVPGQVVVSERSRGFVALHPALDDPGIADVLALMEKKLAEADAKASKGKVPELMRQLRGAQQLSGMKLILPREAWLSVEPWAAGTSTSAEHGNELVASVNLQMLGGAIRAASWAMRRAAEQQAREANLDEDETPLPQVLDHRGHTIHVTPGFVLAIAGTTILLTQTSTAAAGVIDRLQDAPKVAGTVPNRFSSATEGLPERTEVHFVFEEPSRHLPGVVALAPQTAQPLFAQVRRAAGTLDLVTADEVQGALLLDCADGVEPEAARQAVEVAAVYLVDRAAEQKLTLSAQARVEGRRVRVDYHLTGLRPKLEVALEEAFSAPTE